MGALIGLFTYFLHGFLNNFLDQDKASAPFWSLIAILVALDVYHKSHGVPEGQSTENHFDKTEIAG
jgi:hypothetical protein